MKTSTDSLRFLRERVLTVTDIMRTKKLTEILDEYAKGESEDIFVVENTRNKNAKAILLDFEYFERLLMYEEAIEDTLDELMYKKALERMDHPTDIDLADVIDGLQLDVEEIIRMSEMIGEDE
jgi:hypothetical protein